MIEATCSACGTLNRIVETDVPSGAKFVNCASCKSRVAIPTKTAMGAAPMKVPASPPAKGVPAAGGPSLDLADLPAPKRSSAIGGVPEPARPAPRSGLAAALDAGDLPAPKARGTSGPIELESPGQRPRTTTNTKNPLDLDDLLAPTGKSSSRGADPAPKGEIVDLPAPKRNSGGITDLPTPKGPPGGIVDLPTPKGGGQRPTAKRNTNSGDLLTPVRPSGPDLPAPKGFFEDLPQSAGAAANARPDLPAPKGFFDDLPQSGGPRPELPAPKGFFEDLPGRTNQPQSQGVAPLGFFDDLPANRSSAGSTSEVAPKGFFDDVPQLSRGSQAVQPAGAATQGITPRGDLEPIPDMTGSAELDLAPHYGDDLDLSKPSTPAAGSMRYESPTAQRSPGDGLPSFSRSSPSSGGEVALELEEPRVHSPLLAPKRAATAGPSQKEVVAAQSSQRLKLFGGIALGVLLLGAGAFVLFQKHSAKEERGDQIDEQLGKARSSLAAIDSGHWQRAATAAKAVLELDPTNGEALGCAAEASLAGAYDDGANAVARAGAGRKYISDAQAAGVSSPALDRARALSALTLNQPDGAIAKLEPMLKQGKDANVALYLGWAQSAKGDQTAAIKSFDTAMAINPSMKIPALYARARAKLAQTDLEGARADFNAILALAKDHIGAQVGLAAAEPTSKATQQEADLLAILARKDIATADPRAVVRAWVIAADDAARANRLDAARDRYHKALALDAGSISAQTGLAEVELRDGRTDAASDIMIKALTVAPDDVHAQLVATQISIKLGKLDDAATRLKVLAGRAPTLSPLEQGAIQLVTGKLLEAKNQDDAAVDAYVAGAKIVGDLDLAATVAAVNKLTKLAQIATDAKDLPRAEKLRARADALLGEREEHAKDDPELSLTLGVAYLDADNPVKAEPWLRRTADARPSDPDALFQLAKAYLKQGKVDDSLALLKKAIELDPARTEIGLELARAYEFAERDDDAGPLYTKLLDSKDPSLELRSRAGRFFARIGEMGKAADQGAEILKIEHANAAGLYLKAEGLLASGKLEDARKTFQLAVGGDRDAQYFDGLGRAAAAEAVATGDVRFSQMALQAYQSASELAPKMFNPLLGQGEILYARREAKKAIEPLQKAWAIKQDATVARLMGSALQDLNNVPNATEWLQKANDLKPTYETSRRLGELYRDSANDKGVKAMAAYAKATELGVAEEKATGKSLTTLTDAWYQLGKLRLDLGDKAGARAAWQQFVDRVPPPPPDARTNNVRRALNGELRR